MMQPIEKVTGLESLGNVVPEAVNDRFEGMV